MQVVIIKKDKIYKYPYPNENINVYWLEDINEFGSQRQLISIEKKNNSWFVISNENCIIEKETQEINELPLVNNNFIKLKIKSNQNQNTEYAILFTYQENDPLYTSYEIIKDGDYIIGRNSLCSIIMDNEFIAEEHAILSKKGNEIFVKSKDNNAAIYVNDIRTNNKKIENGNIIFIYGYRIIFLNNLLIISNYNKGLRINSETIIKKEISSYSGELLETEEDDNATIYSEGEYYSRAPRFLTSIIEENIKIDSPPGKVEPDDTPVLYTIGPMLTMAMSSIVSASTSIINLMNGRGTLLTVLPTTVISVAMLGSTLLWPSLTRKYNNKKLKRKEEERQRKYINYLSEKRKTIENLRLNQFQILTENYPAPKNLENIIINKRRNLWERLIESEDFLRVRVGIGTIPLKINLNYAIEDFSMIEDNLKEELKKVGESAKDIQNAPITVDLPERNKLVLIGDNYHRETMLKSIIIQLATYHSYNDLKLVFMINDDIGEIWDSVKILPHVWSNTRDIRFYANNYNDMSKISFYLEQVFTQRKYSENDGNRTEINLTYRNTSPYYLIIVDNIKKNKNIEIINKILKENNNLGFGLIILNDGISNLPNECNDFLTAAGEKSAIIKNDLNKNNQQSFIMDYVNDINIPLMFEKLSNIPIKLPLMLDEIKSSVGFLEMYKIGKVEQLNIAQRWNNNNPVNSLSVPIGIHTDGELFNLDLHEKFHGPHGLIAGMTGSGKSEFIITFILSMCANFNPYEVSFVLIDYKGGGLAGAFENKLAGIKLPHLAGTITNLDTAEIKRSLSSIESELKRRQTLFNQAKTKLNESTIDIYKYQKLYRDGLIKEPISHLFIISDEFAELKSQQPEFMDELISTARIGRSLGVHLILATQKPSGIVDDQIWSNSKFKVCLKVQERSDSMDVIKCPDAASLKKAGRFYLQVGYNDYFAMGQAAYAGTKYIPREKIVKTVDRDISFVNDIGDITKSVETTKIEQQVSKGEELPNILKHICEIASEKNMVANKLWLDRIPNQIFVNNLINKYAFKPKKWEISAIIGEYDDPERQKQGILTLNFNENGNTIIYGIDGKEITIASIIYSLIITHNSDEINLYIIDFGSQMFGSFKNAPQVGDVVFINEAEKLNNLFNNISKELEKRKKLFTDYNGDYNIYIKNSGSFVPRLIVIINNYEALNENYEDYIDKITSLSREGEKYGISFVITATGTNAVRTRTSQNFSNNLCLQFNDPSDYSNILGSTHGLIPSNALGRGLVKLEGNVYEFQTAYPYIWDEINTFIKEICNKLNKMEMKKAKNIKILPEHVRLENIISKISDLKNIPIGIRKDTLEVSTFNFSRNPISIISAQDTLMLEKFIPSLGQVFQHIKSLDFYMIDAIECIKQPEEFTNYYSTNGKEIVDKLEEVINNQNSRISVFLIFGIDALKTNLQMDEQNRLKTLLLDIKTKQHVKVILADAVSKIKQFEYDDFYRTNVQPIYGIWAGSGITDQFTIKSSTYTKETRGQIENEFGFIIERGNAKLIKMLDFYTKDN